MQHDLAAKGLQFALRPVSVDDAEFLVALRTDPVRAKYLHKTSPSIDDQIAWTRAYFDREGDWYFLVTNLQGEPEGAVAIYNYDPVARTAEFGRWILKPGSRAALESAVLAHDIGFGELEMSMIYTRTEDENPPVISFLNSFGSVTEGPVIGPNDEHWIEQRMTMEAWPGHRARLTKLLERMAGAGK